MIRSDFERLRWEMRQAGKPPRKTLVEQMEDVMGELYSYAADESNLARVSGEPEDERFLLAYNCMVDALSALERVSK
jgi:hypothetical protein